MPGVLPPNNEYLLTMLGRIQNQLAGIATNQQLVFTNAEDEIIMTTGLVPGSNPAEYGLVLYNPATGAQIAFLGEGANGVGVSLTIAYPGSLEVLSQTGNSVLAATTAPIPDGSGRTQQIVVLSRDDGSVALELSDNGTTPGHAHQQALQWVDRLGANIVVADDTTSGYGLARPHITAPPMANTNVASWPSTSATSYTAIMTGWFEQQNPGITFGFWIAADTGTTAVFRFKVNGAVVATSSPVTGGSTTWSGTHMYGAGSWTFGSIATLELDAVVTAGSGSARATQLLLQGAQS